MYSRTRLTTVTGKKWESKEPWYWSTSFEGQTPPCTHTETWIRFRCVIIVVHNCEPPAEIDVQDGEHVEAVCLLPRHQVLVH